MNGLSPRWKKLGKIFDPTQHTLSSHGYEFAQSPQVLIRDSEIRVYFSTRRRDEVGGKFRSHVLYVDFDSNLNQILRVADKPVISLGGLGCFDEHGIFPFHVLHGDEKIHAYTCGWSRRRGVSVETAIGLAISEDGGDTFYRHGDGPILAATLNEPCLVGDGFVVRTDDAYHMWYIYGHPWRNYAGGNEPERIYKIAHATSTDGVHWEKTGGQQLIADAIGHDECQALPTVVQWNGLFHMYFCYRYPNDFRRNPKRGYRIGYALSEDLVRWHRDDSNAGIELSPSTNHWDGCMMCYPHVFLHQDQLFMLYNGNEFGRHGFGLAIAE